MAFSNPVIEVYRGVKIRKYPTVSVRVTPDQMKEIIDGKLDHDLSERQCLKKMSIICNDSSPIIIKSNYAKGN